METLEASRICRLCGNNSEIAINIFDKKETIINKIHTVLPISVHEMDMLPKKMCHRCSYKLEEFHKFYIHCIKTDEHLKSQLSWMNKDKTDKIDVPMVQIGTFKIKTELIDVDNLDNPLSKSNTPFIIHNGLAPFSNVPPHCHCNYRRYNLKRLQTSNKTTDKISTPPSSNLVPNVIHNLRVSSNEKSRDIKSNPQPEKTTLTEKLDQQVTLSALGLVKQNLLSRLESPTKSTREDTSKRRMLRPRRNSVDYVLSRKKSTEPVRMQSETSHVSLETPNTQPKVLESPAQSESKSELQLKITPVKIKVESGLRALRPRKTDVNYQPINHKRKQTVDMKSSKKCNYAQTSIDSKAGIKSGDYNASGLLDKSKENREDEKDKVAMDFSKIILKTENEEIKSRNKFVNKDSGHKSKSEKQCFSPIRLRSQDIQLRNGKIKSNLSLNKEIRIFEKRGDKLFLRSRLQNNRKSYIKIKQFCEKCNISYLNKKHKCSSD